MGLLSGVRFLGALCFARTLGDRSPSLYWSDSECSIDLTSSGRMFHLGVGEEMHGTEMGPDWWRTVDRNVHIPHQQSITRNQALKYPLIVKRLACMVMSGAASAESLDILQPASLSSQMILQMEEGYDLLRSGFAMANIPQECMAFLTKEWYNNVLARIRINAFRIELPIGSYEDLLSSASACVDAEAAVGNSVYILPSFYNHDCDPNTHIIWIDNADARLKALRDIDTDEELRICYIDASMDHDARQNILLHGFGFKCNCPRCLSGD